MQDQRSRKHPVSECPVCGSKRFKYQFPIAEHRLVCCAECAFTLLNPQPSDETLGSIYGPGYFLNEQHPRHRQEFDLLKTRTAEAYLEQLELYSGFRNGRLLEIGSGTGALLVAAARRGFQVTGIEYSSSACEETRGRLAEAGLEGEVVCGELESIAHREGEFDLCVIADVIEHVRDPRQLVCLVHRLLRPGGAVFIATPSLDSWSARIMAARWMEFKPEHLSYFNRKTLEGLLFAEGFRQLAWEPGKKVISYNYVAAHFAKFPIPFYSGFVRAVGAMLPGSVRARERHITGSGMIVMATRSDKPTRPKLSIIVPVFNEAASFATAFERLLDHPIPNCDVEYIVIESNSTDGTREIVKRYADRPGVHVILEDRPRGKGFAVRAGLEAATGDFALIQDADLEYDLEDYDSLLEPLLANREAFVLGARHGGRAWKMRQFAGQPVTSLALNFGHWIFTTLINLCFLVRLRDPFTMYKVFRRDCIHGLDFECDRFDFDWELVIKLIRRGYVPVEIPVNYRSRSFTEGKKVSVVRDPLTWMRALVRFRLARVPRWTPRPAVAPPVRIEV